MIKSINVETNLFSTEHPHISKYTSVSSILLSLGIALIGILCVVLSLYIDQSSSTLCMTLLTLGTILILVALYRAFGEVLNWCIFRRRVRLLKALFL